MAQVELLLALLGAAAGLALLARTINIPYPILLVVGGLILAFVPGLPAISLPPDLIFLIFFPPLLYSASVTSSPRNLTANLRPIGSLAIGFVLASMLAVALAAHAAIAGMAWPAAFALGAIIATPDPVAATAVVERMHAPRQVLTILEGEGLFNDATGLTAYRIAVAAAVTGTFSLAGAFLSFVLAALGGVAIGLLVGVVAWRIRLLVDDPSVEVLISLLTPYAAWIPADALGLSGILSVVTTGLYIGGKALGGLESDVRLRATAVWNQFSFILESLLFILMGLAFRAVWRAVASYSLVELLSDVLLVILTVIVVRIVWSFGARWVSWAIAQTLHLHVPRPKWRIVAVVSWTGMRGADSLAPALALPLVAVSGQPFPDRSLIIFLTFCVILATLVLQGLSLPILIGWLGLHESAGEDHDVRRARRAMARGVVARLHELAGENWVPHDELHRLIHVYSRRAMSVAEPEQEHALADRRAALVRLRRAVLLAQRGVLARLRERGVIGNDVLRRLQQELDLEELQLETLDDDGGRTEEANPEPRTHNENPTL